MNLKIWIVLVTKTEVKLDTSGSYATLPKTRPKGNRQSTDVSTVSSKKSTQSSSVLNLDAVDVETQNLNQRRGVSRVQSYRMQTESSQAKLNPVPVVVRRSFGSTVNSKFQSTPNLASDNDEDLDAMSRSMDATGLKLQETKTEMDELDEKDENRNISDGVGSYARLSKQLPVVVRDKELMPPPLTTSVPAAVQNSFLTKANKHRRSCAPEINSVPQSRSMTHAQLNTDSNRSEPDVGHGMDASPLELPVRDTDNRSSSQVEMKLSMTSTVKSTTQLLRKSSSPPDTKTSSPTVVRIGRCTSPIRPFSAIDSAMLKEKSAFGQSPSMQRRMLPADPRSIAAADAREQSPFSDQSSSRPSSTDSSSFSPVSSAHGKDLLQQKGMPTIQKHSPHFSILSRSPTNHNVTFSLPSRNPMNSPDVESNTNWVKRAEHIQQQWEQRHQNSGKDSLPSGPSAVDDHIINEIERHCEEIRLSDQKEKAEKPDKYSLPGSLDVKHAKTDRSSEHMAVDVSENISEMTHSKEQQAKANLNHSNATRPTQLDNSTAVTRPTQLDTSSVTRPTQLDTSTVTRPKFSSSLSSLPSVEDNVNIHSPQTRRSMATLTMGSLTPKSSHDFTSVVELTNASSSNVRISSATRCRAVLSSVSSSTSHSDEFFPKEGEPETNEGLPPNDEPILATNTDKSDQNIRQDWKFDSWWWHATHPSHHRTFCSLQAVHVINLHPQSSFIAFNWWWEIVSCKKHPNPRVGSVEEDPTTTKFLHQRNIDGWLTVVVDFSLSITSFLCCWSIWIESTIHCHLSSTINRSNPNCFVQTFLRLD